MERAFFSDFSDLNIYNEPLVDCPLCGSGIINQHYIIKRYNPKFKVDKCRGCGFIFMNPQLNNKIVSELYNFEYYSGNAEYFYYDERDAEKFSNYVWQKRLKKIKRYTNSGNFLDVGCAFGGFLKAVSKDFIPYGIELSVYSSKHARELFGKNIHTGALEDHPFPENFFSVISMIELLEHVKDPVFTIAQCRNLLKKDGLLVIQTANMDGMQARLLKDRYAYFMPGHLSYFSKENLANLLRKAGFQKIIVFYPVEFGLLPKLLKSRNNFNSRRDYMKWLRIIGYHYLSKIQFGNFAATSSMVIYAIK